MNRVRVLAACPHHHRPGRPPGDSRPSTPDTGWRHAITLALIGTGAWLLAGVLTSVERTALSRLRIGDPDNRRARRAQTQLTLVRRFTIAVIAVIALGAMLMTFPAARAAGTSLLASAGVVGAIAALVA